MRHGGCGLRRSGLYRGGLSSGGPGTRHPVGRPEAKRGIVLLARRWVVERSFVWATRFRRLVKAYERMPDTAAGLHLVAFA